MVTNLAEAYSRRLLAFHDSSPVVERVDEEEFFNKNHDPKDGRFTSGSGQAGGKTWTGVSAHPDRRTTRVSGGIPSLKTAKGAYEADLGDGYRSHVTEINRDGAIDKLIYVRGEIRFNGARRGYFERELFVDVDGALVANHQLLVIDGHHKGLGVADRFNAHAVAEYQKMGVDRITLTAGDNEYTVGGYAWARQGFRLDGTIGSNRAFLTKQLDRIDTQLLKPVYREHAARVRKEVAALRKALEAGEDIQPIHIASIGERYARHKTADEEGVSYQTWPGKDVLLGTSWKGVYYFDANRAITSAATDLEHAALRPAFRIEVEEFFNKNHSPQDGKFTSGTGGSSPSGHGKTMTEIGEIDYHKFDPMTGYSESGMIKHLGSLAVTREMTDREHVSVENDLDYEVKDFSSGSREPFAEAVAIANANVATVPRTTVGISVQLGAIWDRYADMTDDFKIMDKVTDALTRYEGEYQTDLRGARAKLSRQLEVISGVSVASGFVSYVHQQWANSAHSHESVAMQLIAAKDRNLTAANASLKRHVNPGDLAVARALVKKAPDALGAVFSATYRLTQRELAKHGITEIELYRGVNISGMRTTSAVNSLAKIIAQPSPLSSWSTSQTEAFNFSLHGKMFKATVKASQVYSLANLTGTGSLSEREVLVLGNRITATEHELQISNADAQNFNDFAEEEILVVEIDAEDFDWIKKRSVIASAEEHFHSSGGIEFACHDKSCAPPPVGVGGSTKGGTTQVAVGDVRVGHTIHFGSKKGNLAIADGPGSYKDNLLTGSHKVTGVEAARSSTSSGRVGGGQRKVIITLDNGRVYTSNSSTKVPVTEDHEPGFKVITAAQARGDSRPVSHDEFQRLATIGQAQLDRFAAKASPITRLDRNWDQIKRDAYEEVKKSWGGATIDSHTGEALPQGANAFAITVKGKNGKTVSVHEDASAEEFGAAMDTARARFGTILARQSHYLGVFHDNDNGRIDIDPVLVVRSSRDVETIGAASHSVGGAYNFRDGLGYFPPHVDTSPAATNKRDDYVRTYDSPEVP